MRRAQRRSNPCVRFVSLCSSTPWCSAASKGGCSPCAPWPSGRVGTWRNRRVGPNQASKLVSAEATTLARRNAMSHQELYVGLDVSLEKTSICVVDYQGATIWRGSCPTDAAAIADAIRAHAPSVARVGLETGQMSNWLTLALRRRGLPVICLDARHAKAALKLQLNKTDANDAWGLAQIVRTGWFREVAVKSMDAQQLRMLLVARSQIVGQRQAIANNIRGLMKTFGIVIARGAKGLFAVRVRQAGEGNHIVMAIVDPLLAAWQSLREQTAVFDRQIMALAKRIGMRRAKVALARKLAVIMHRMWVDQTDFHDRQVLDGQVLDA